MQKKIFEEKIGQRKYNEADVTICPGYEARSRSKSRVSAEKVDEQEVGTLTLIRQDPVTVVVNFMDRVSVIVVELSTLCRLFSFIHCSVIVCCK
ncbi:Protein of unknown function, partial [Cotesia congregata]